VQVTPSGIVKDSTRWKELFGNDAKAAQKVLWHQVAWRYHNQFATIPYTNTGEAVQIGHTCGLRSCGAAAHLRLMTRSENESQKRCGYVYTTDEKTGEPTFYLACVHTPPCVPQSRQSTPLTVVKDVLLLLNELKNIRQTNIAASSSISLSSSSGSGQVHDGGGEDVGGGTGSKQEEL